MLKKPCKANFSTFEVMNFFSRVNQHTYGCPRDNAKKRYSSMLNAYTKEVLQFVKKYGQLSCLVPGYHGEDLLVGTQGQVLGRAGCLGKDLDAQPLCRGYNCTQVKANVVKKGSIEGDGEGKVGDERRQGRCKSRRGGREGEV